MGRHSFVAIALVVALSAPAGAEVTGGAIVRQTGAGQFVKLDTTTPFRVGADNFDTDDLYAFDEDQNIVLRAALQVDFGPGDRTIVAGTVVASHYVFFDSLAGTHVGYVDFDAPILGVAALPATLDASDYLANSGVEYISTDLRGLEGGDSAWIDAEDPQRLWVYWAGSSPGDYIRVFTAQSPNVPMM